MEIEHEESPVPPPEEEEAKEPPRIQRLSESVVNRIAAGEVIQRPVSAVKELVENSLDAHSTSINLLVKDGGLKLIQVSDDGHGIRLEDLPILCERHTTSKLSAFEDLQSIKSMGFRGEALASMTYVAHVTVTTITKGQLHGYRVSYRDGLMENEPRPCAAVKGTQIMVENLFYNMAARRKTLQNASDDYSKIVDLISRFAIQHINVSFSCRKHGATRADVHTVATSSRLDAIRSVYGISVARNLMKIEASDNNPATSIFEMQGYMSNANYASKKITMVLFINDRLVECSALKRAIEIVYAATLPKASKPFIYISIVLPPENVDVNVHPTKREVSLLNQEVIIEKIQSVIESRLRSSNETRTYQEQTADQCSLSHITSKEAKLIPLPMGSRSQKVPVHKLVRTDSLDPAGRLHAYIQTKLDGHLEKRATLNAVSKELMYQQVLSRFGQFNAIQLSDPAPLKDLIILALKEEDLVSECNDDDNLKEKIAEMNTELLKQKAEMLDEYFGIHIDKHGNISRLPVILDQYTPDMDHIPEFALCLGNDVNWEDERNCIQAVAAALGNFYAMHPPILPNPSGKGLLFYKKRKMLDSCAEGNTCDVGSDVINDKVEQELLSEAETAWTQREWSIQHVLFPSMRLFLKPPVSMATDGTFVRVASLEKLYKIFERC
ncbi:DNA mismatch repair protein MLH1 isoform X4 [Arachis hypogaea]|uniref:DNA mismatch repair protein MLH1 isoform X4 n=1 Tax=Arachis hypogaea TaxID=3818 RepID=UPI003B21CB90